MRAKERVDERGESKRTRRAERCFVVRPMNHVHVPVDLLWHAKARGSCACKEVHTTSSSASTRRAVMIQRKRARERESFQRKRKQGGGGEKESLSLSHTHTLSLYRYHPRQGLLFDFRNRRAIGNLTSLDLISVKFLQSKASLYMLGH